MSLPFSVLVARACAKQPHRSAIAIAQELSDKIRDASAQKHERARTQRPKLYATKTTWSSNYDNY